MRRLGVLVFGVVLLAAACGGDDGGGGGAGGGSAGLAEGEAAPEGVEGAVATDIDEADHQEGNLDYPSSPPTAGTHNPVWANCRFYEEPVPDENAVHSLEHGAVWVAYAEDLAAEEVGALEQLAGGSDHLLVAPYPGLDSPIVLTAWNRQLAVDSGSDPRVLAFLETYLDGPTAPEVEAPCSGGAG